MEKIFKLLKKSRLSQTELKNLLLSSDAFASETSDITYKGGTVRWH
jgi:hypothetical protein